MTSKLVVNTIEADTGISSVSFASSISMNSTAKFHFSAAGFDIGADTNINRPAAGVLAFNINSSEKVRITSGGSLLVGKTVGTMATAGTRIDPQSTLITGSSTSTNLATASGAALSLINNSATDNNFSNIGGYNSNSLVTSQINFVNTSHSSRTGDITFMTHNGSSMPERLRIDSSGLMGLGTNSPSSYNNKAYNFVISASGHAGMTIAGGTSSDSSIYFADGTSGAAQYAGWVQYEHDNNALTFGVNTSERFRITSSGQLLVNATSASISSAELFEVKSTGNGFSHFRNNHSGYAPIYIDNEYTNTAMAPLITITDGGGNRAGLLLDQNSVFDITGQGAVSFSTGGTVGNATERLRITNTGRVGINENSPDNILHIKDSNPFIEIEGTTNNSGDVGIFLNANGNHWQMRADNNPSSNAFSIKSGTPASSTHRFTISDTYIDTGSQTITGGNNLALQNFRVKGVWSGSGSIGKEIELISGYDSAVKMTAIGYNLTDVNTGSTYGGDLVFHTQPSYSSPTTPLPERMRISSSGYVTKPETPCFIVRHSAAEIYNGGSYIDGPWTVTLNRGNHFNTSNGIFTAPVAGLYQLNMMMNNDYNNSSRPGNFKIHVNNSLYAGINFDPLDSHGGWFTHTLTGTLNLSRNDTVRLQTGNTARVDNYNWNHWSMYLIG